MKLDIVPKNHGMLPQARALRRNMTPQEAKLWYQFLRNYPVKIYKQRIIESFIVDFIVQRLNWSSKWMAHSIFLNRDRLMTANEALF